MATIESEATPNWRTEGVRIIPRDALDTNTPQTPGMTRAAAVTHDRTGSEKLWAGTATIHPGAKTGAGMIAGSCLFHKWRRDGKRGHSSDPARQTAPSCSTWTAGNDSVKTG